MKRSVNWRNIKENTIYHDISINRMKESSHKVDYCIGKNIVFKDDFRICERAMPCTAHVSAICNFVILFTHRRTTTYNRIVFVFVEFHLMFTIQMELILFLFVPIYCCWSL